MLCLRHPVRYLLAAAALGCLSTISIPVETVLFSSSSGNNDSHNNAEHRGSGRIERQEAFIEKAIAYRGTGRYDQDTKDLNLAHRGSGRVDDDTAESDKVVYRGSGRVSPSETSSSETA